MFRATKRAKSAASGAATGSRAGVVARPLPPWSGLTRLWSPPAGPPTLPVGIADLFNRYAVYHFSFRSDWREQIPWRVCEHPQARAAVVLLCAMPPGKSTPGMFRISLLTARAARSCGPTPLVDVESFLARLHATSAAEVVVGGAVLPAAAGHLPPLFSAGIPAGTVGAPWGWLSAPAAAGSTVLAVTWAERPSEVGRQQFVLSGGGCARSETAVGTLAGGEGVALHAGLAIGRRVGARLAPMSGCVATSDTLSPRLAFFGEADVRLASAAAAGSTELQIAPLAGLPSGVLARGTVIRIVCGAAIPEMVVLAARPAFGGMVSTAWPLRQAWPAGAFVRAPCAPPVLHPAALAWEKLTALTGYEWRPACAVQWPEGTEWAEQTDVVVAPVAVVLSAGVAPSPLAARIRMAIDPTVRPPFSSQTVGALLGGRAACGPRSWVSSSRRGTALLVVDLRAQGDTQRLTAAIWRERVEDNRLRALQSAKLSGAEQETLAVAPAAAIRSDGPICVEALPPCLTPVLSGGAMQTDPDLHMNNEERHVVGQVLQSLCVDIEDAHRLVGASLNPLRRRHFTSHLKRPYGVRGCSQQCANHRFRLCDASAAEVCAKSRGSMAGAVTPVTVALYLQKQAKEGRRRTEPGTKSM